MGLRSTRAVVSGTMRMSDSSKLVSLVTERYGLVKVVAKGARRPRSKYGSALEPVSLADIMYYHKDHRELQTLSDADLVEPWSALKSDIRLLSVASCMVETTQVHTAPEDPAAGMYALLVRSLDELAAGSPKDADKHLWRFMLRLLDAAGYRPEFGHCLACGKRIHGGAVFVSYAEGGVICSCTDHGDRFGVRVSPGALMVMNDLLDADAASLGRLKLADAQRAEVERLILQFLAYHSGSSRRLRSLMFLRRLDSGGTVEKQKHGKKQKHGQD